MTSELTYLTADAEGIGGIIKERPEDFLVEEQPRDEFDDEGEHLILFVEKVNMTTLDLVRRAAKAFRVPRQDIGYAGMKDKHAITRQHLSIHLPDAAGDEEGLRRLGYHPNAKVLWHTRHGRKIRRGYHGGNRFVIRIRKVEPTHAIRAKHVLDRLEARGIPNFIGDQRFGFRQNGHLLGRMLLLDQREAFIDELLGHSHPSDSPTLQRGRAAFREGQYEEAMRHWPRQLRFDRQALDALRQHRSPSQAVDCIDRGQLHFLVTAFQSAVFNRVLDRRLHDDCFDRLLPGDLAWKHDSAAVFEVDQETSEVENAADGRVSRKEVSPSGPMWGSDMPLPQGDVLKIEQDALASYEMTPQQFDDQPMKVEGLRRPLRVFLRDPDISSGVDEHGAFIRLAFELQRGSFATMVLREIMKVDMHRPNMRSDAD